MSHFFPKNETHIIFPKPSETKARPDKLTVDVIEKSTLTHLDIQIYSRHPGCSFSSLRCLLPYSPLSSFHTHFSSHSHPEKQPNLGSWRREKWFEVIETEQMQGETKSIWTSLIQSPISEPHTATPPSQATSSTSYNSSPGSTLTRNSESEPKVSIRATTIVDESAICFLFEVHRSPSRLTATKDGTVKLHYPIFLKSDSTTQPDLTASVVAMNGAHELLC